MAEISVLMSVYNEKEEELYESINSILKQTFTDFEFIIILDSPQNKNAYKIVKEYAERDTRIKVIQNKKNIGLAMSLNKGAKIATGNYLVRMDADDISHISRLEKQYKVITEGNYDLVCSRYQFIDEYGNLLDKQVDYYEKNLLIKLLPLQNVIHHPTVIIKADSFRRIGGYRNFPCAQDYDLWLRMVNAGYKFFMMSEELLLYRVRADSITNKNRYKQYLTIKYIRSNYNSIKKYGKDRYSQDNYIEYLKKHKVGDKRIEQEFLNNYNKYQGALDDIRKKKNIHSIIMLLQILLTSKIFRSDIYRGIKFRTLLKFYNMIDKSL